MTPELATKLAGRRVIASVSGGKDSAALSLWLTEQGIDQEWARTGKGGKQFELFSSTDADAGCMRWGLCETSDK